MDGKITTFDCPAGSEDVFPSPLGLWYWSNESDKELKHVTVVNTPNFASYQRNMSYRSNRKYHTSTNISKLSLL